eukprot:gene10304-12056_t
MGSTTAGGYNGGGAPGAAGSVGGGGASDIRTSLGLESRIVVAAGGGGDGLCGSGGGGWYPAGGAGVAVSTSGACALTNRAGAGGTGSSGGIADLTDCGVNGGKFGKGGNGCAGVGGGGGGGGYYGGAGGFRSSGGGGSSFITAPATPVDMTQRYNGGGSITIHYSVPYPENAVIYNYNGGYYTYTVPERVTRLWVELHGAWGNCWQIACGGLGGMIRATLPVTPGETLRFYIGGMDSNGPGFNGAGVGSYGYISGGGGTDVRRAPYGLEHRLLVAGGGGGCHHTCGASGGDGGYPSGMPGKTGPLCSQKVGGNPGNQTAGGAISNATHCASGTSGGSFGKGGDGCGEFGVGGGGGWFGGGSGYFSGGGGGSSYSSVAEFTYQNGENSKNGYAVISALYDPSALPTLAPSIEPTTSPTCNPTADPTTSRVIYSKAPTLEPTSKPTLSELSVWSNELQIVLSEVTASDTGAIAHRSTYYDLNVVSASPQQRYGGCSAWSRVLAGDVNPSQYAFKPRSIAMRVLANGNSHDRLESFNPRTVTCNDATITSSIVAALTSRVAVSRTFSCDAHVWSVRHCPVVNSGITIQSPAVCVDCSDPCAVTNQCNTGTSLSTEGLSVAPCVQSDCSGFSGSGSHLSIPTSLRVLSVSYADLEQAPTVVTSNVVAGRTSIQVTARLSSRGSLFCAVYRASGIPSAPSSATAVQLQNFVSSTDATNTTTVTIAGLDASTTYKLYFMTVSPAGVRMVLDQVLTSAKVINTACCKTVTGALAAPAFVEARSFATALTVTLSARPSSALVVGLVLYSVSGNTTSLYSQSLFPSTFTVSQISPTILSASLPALPVGLYEYRIVLSGASAAEFSPVYANELQRFAVITSATEPPTPTLQQPVFASDGSLMTVKFSASTNRGGTASSFACGALFDFSCAATSKCQWVDASTVRASIQGVVSSSNCAQVGASFSLSAAARIKAKCRALGDTGNGYACPNYANWKTIFDALSANTSTTAVITVAYNVALNASETQAFIQRSLSSAAADADDTMTPCYIGAIDCLAVCECDADYYGSDMCDLTTEEFALRQASRSNVIAGLQTLVSMENSDEQVIGGWVSGLQLASQQAAELTEDSSLAVLGLVDSITAAATALSTGEDAQVASLSAGTMQGLLKAVSSVTAYTSKAAQRRRLASMRRGLSAATSSDGETAHIVTGVLNNVGSLVAQSMLPGQSAINYTQGDVRMSVQVLADSLSNAGNITAAVPQTTLEAYLEQPSSCVSVPASSTDGVSLVVSSVRSELFDYVDSDLHSNPVILYASSDLCAEPPCYVDLVIQNSQAVDYAALNAPSVYIHNVTCEKAEHMTYNVTCPDGTAMQMQCNGTAGILHRQCPVTTYSAVCSTLGSASGAMKPSGCITYAYTDTEVICRCDTSYAFAQQRRLQSGNFTVPSGYSASYAAMLSSTANSFVSTISTADDLNASTVTKGWRALATLGELACAIIIALFWSNYYDGKAKKVVPEPDLKTDIVPASLETAKKMKATRKTMKKK